MNVLFSPSLNSFYPEDMREDYEQAGTLPPDVVSVPYAVFAEFSLDAAPEGKTRAVGGDGLPVWAALPEPTNEQLIASADARKNELLYLAAMRMAPLEDASELDLATDDEVESLRQWKAYRIALSRISTQPGYPASIQWPEPPN
ncbi:tail fiber assembly protein [Achromobacter xylosoxidans]|uniref:tail fiber assembly protein n=1 Tax=Alcaligenes xylosoxydans xylosoxydans TaxID=85698 RepID=UPI0009EBE66C|nr:tail fiber assembly protein [Achromobacter xylosoxidans]